MRPGGHFFTPPHPACREKCAGAGEQERPMTNSQTPAPIGFTTAGGAGVPRIYVACLTAYNNGCLHGRWIEATTPDEIREEVRAMLAASPLPDAEE